jgi:hypothetical protein
MFLAVRKNAFLHIDYIYCRIYINIKIIEFC